MALFCATRSGPLRYRGGLVTINLYKERHCDGKGGTMSRNQITKDKEKNSENKRQDGEMEAQRVH